MSEDRLVEDYGKAMEKVLVLGSRQELLEDFSEWLLDELSAEEWAEVISLAIRQHPEIEEILEAWERYERG